MPSSQSWLGRVRRGRALLVASAFALGASGAALAQGDAPSDEAPRQAAPPSSDIEVLTVLAGESEAAADFKSGDSIAAFGAEDLSAIGAQSVADLASFTPNLEIVTTGESTPTFFIRGVGLNDFNANSTGAVAIYQDDVPLNAPPLQLFTIFDVTDVNVLRGPQGTGQARNASAGAIKAYSQRPSGQYGGFLSTELGNYGFVDVEGAVEAPIFEDIIAARLAFRYTDREGFARNDCGNAPPRSARGVSRRINNTAPFDPATGLPISICGEAVQRPSTTFDGISPIPEGLPREVNDQQNWAARMSLLFLPTLDSEWLLTVRGSRRDQLARLGQAIGTRGEVYEPSCLQALEDDIQARFGRDPNRSERNNSGCAVQRTLGGRDNGFYRAPEVVARSRELDPCVNADGTVVRTGACSSEYARFKSENNAALALAEELTDLDSDPYRGQWNRVGPLKNDVWGATLKGETVFGRSFVLTNVTSADGYDRLQGLDLDNSPNQLFEVETDDEGWQFFQGIDLRSDATEETPFSWNIGALYLTEELDVAIQNSFLPERSFTGVGARDYVQTLHSIAGYVSFEADFWKDFTLDGGFRYNYERKEIDYLLSVNNVPARSQQLVETWRAPTGTVRLTYRFREDTFAYWKYTRGWKPGTFNATSSPREGVSAADAETIDAFEAGLNGSWFDGRMNLGLTVFHYNYESYQIFLAQQVLGAQPEFVIINANNAEVTGAELFMRLRPFSGTFVEANVSWLDSTFLDFVQRQQGTEQRGGNAIPTDVATQNAGNPLLNSPRFKVALTVEQTLPLGRYGALVARWDGAWTDDTAYDPTAGRGLPNSQGVQFLPENTIAQSAYWLHNVRLTYKTPDGSVEVAAWARNLTDKAAKSFAFDASNFNATTVYFVSDPRTFGGSLRINF